MTGQQPTATIVNNPESDLQQNGAHSAPKRRGVSRFGSPSHQVSVLQCSVLPGESPVLPIDGRLLRCVILIPEIVVNLRRALSSCPDGRRVANPATASCKKRAWGLLTEK
ncbi:hypothetical protein [Herbaspirillum camelliae]|uniref:hypothetical protein n=1 Tax=Herbaspirillum camelliae TaxID=1892903 RepID=UPI000B152CD8|nr:hypothetical protein [Herbaspirillum camelliae]